MQAMAMGCTHPANQFSPPGPGMQHVAGNLAPASTADVLSKVLQDAYSVKPFKMERFVALVDGHYMPMVTDG